MPRLGSRFGARTAPLRRQQPARSRAPARPTATPARPQAGPAAAKGAKPAPAQGPKPAAAESAKPAAARDPKPAAAPRGVVDQPAADKPGGWGGFLQGLQKKAEGVVASVQPKLTPEQRQAAESVRDMLGPDKLGGADRTFNHGDLGAVTQGLLRDTPGLSREVEGQLRAEGKNFQANLVGKALAGRRGPLKAMARNKVYQEAPGQIRGQLQRGLTEAKVDPATARTPDQVPRNLTFNEVHTFERNAKILQAMQRQTEERLGLQIDFPGGMRQDAIQHMLDGKLGFPPGAVVKPRK